MRNPGEPVNGRFTQGAVNEEAIMVADESERDDANRLEDSAVNDEGTTQFASRLRGNAECLRDDCHDDNDHAY